MSASTSIQTSHSAALRAHPVCRRIKAAVRAVEPDAEVWLFGSRARGDAREESDWDVLVTLGGTVTFARDIAITRALFRAFPPGDSACVTAIVRHADEFAGERSPTAFLRNVAADAVPV